MWHVMISGLLDLTINVISGTEWVKSQKNSHYFYIDLRVQWLNDNKMYLICFGLNGCFWFHTTGECVWHNHESQFRLLILLC